MDFQQGMPAWQKDLLITLDEMQPNYQTSASEYVLPGEKDNSHR